MNTMIVVIPSELLPDLLVAADLLRGRNKAVADRLSSHFSKIHNPVQTDDQLTYINGYKAGMQRANDEVMACLV